MVVCAVSGVAASGKTTLCQKLGPKMGYAVLDLKEFIKTEGLAQSYDKSSHTMDVDVSHLVERFEKIGLNSNTLVDGLLSHHLPVSHVIILRANPELLYERMLCRGYPMDKILENLEAEYLATITRECGDKKNVLEIDSSKPKYNEIRGFLKQGGRSLINPDWSEQFQKTLLNARPMRGSQEPKTL
ncbi:MAG: AAA family ATPase [Candidatus Altiarchaeales archaeon]|nr:AAA family ATPase [Candidatus Altiarchaeales archaeon]